MINNNFPDQPQLTNEQFKEKDTHNITEGFACQENPKINECLKKGICITTVANQVNPPEYTTQKSPASKLQHYSVSTNEGMIRPDPKSTACESSAAEVVLPENMENSKEPSIIKIATRQSVDGLISKDKQWLSFLQDFYKQTPVQVSSIDRITNLQKKAEKIEEIIFLLENKEKNKGYGNLNLFIEFLRNFVRLSPGTLQRIRFSGCEHTLANKLPNLISGLPDRDIDDAAIHRDTTHRLSSPETEPKKIFGIPYIVEPGQPKEFISKNTLQIYTYWDSFEVSTEAPLFQITNYRWFPMLGIEDLNLKNWENHLPIYPYVVNENTSTPELMKMEIMNSLQKLNPAIQGYDLDKLAQFFTVLFQSAKESKIYLALSYHRCGMSKSQYLHYVNAVKACFSDKPIVMIAPNNEKNFLSEKERKELSDTIKLQFSTDYSLDFTNDKSLKDNVTVFEFDFLPKRLFELVCYFSNIPIYAPGASTANMAQCLNKPYLGLDGHSLPKTGNQETLDHWKVVNDAFYLNSYDMQEVKSALKTMSKEEIKLSKLSNMNLWNRPEHAHLDLFKIYFTITKFILEDSEGLFLTIMPYFFNETNTSNVHENSADYRQRFFERVVDAGRLPEFCQYVCDKSHEILVDYMSRATTPGESFYELARELQQKALHPDNNMMLEVLETNLPSD
ncbi:hypothetical protein [Endozoicomonas sp. GU-1]|uniref:hypothetical protein n=1 Tax=Endozoicomonas sp. GU-1 TaxID=3009078 RepID=UPI0022B3975D|nr:hypothetical protein [Endozoicomonas sp. GU-1]WBA81882.1 hypothetical protein O2T12_01535 [Endozoicomonas sp. GU-1]WBA84835.1 hypothetical protein O3276_16330 [Endozoicomonas sp. GU-1]